MAVQTKAQRFFNPTAAEVKTDSVVPHFCHTEPLPDNYRDSVYTVSIVYPGIYRHAGDRCFPTTGRHHSVLPPAMPELRRTSYSTAGNRSSAHHSAPVVYRSGKYQLLVSFLLKREASVKGGAKNSAPKRKADVVPAERYAAHSVLATGKWVKIRVSASGFHQITESLIRKAGFSDINKVKLYGYGGNLKNEILNADDLINTDDLKEVPTYKSGNRRVFYARGPVSWASNASTVRTRNPYPTMDITSSRSLPMPRPPLMQRQWRPIPIPHPTTSIPITRWTPTRGTTEGATFSTHTAWNRVLPAQ